MSELEEDGEVETQPDAGSASGEGTHIPGEQSPTEVKARQMGWVPQDEWKGDPDKWREADEFVRYGEEHNGILRQQLDKALARLDTIEGEYASKFQNIERMNNLALKRQRDSLVAKYEAEKRKAVSEGDEAAYDKAVQAESADLERLAEEAEAAAKPSPAKGPTIPAEQAQAVKDWAARNEWFRRDHVLNATAHAIHEDLLRSKPGLSVKENLAEVEKEVRLSLIHI